MKKILSLLACIAAGIFIFTGCGGSQADTTSESSDSSSDTEIVGTWAEDYFDSGYVFNADGTGTDTFWDLTFTYTAKDGVLVTTYDDELYGSTEYSYTISGDTLSMTRKDTDESFEYEKQVASKKSADETTDTSETTDDSSSDETTAN